MTLCLILELHPGGDASSKQPPSPAHRALVLKVVSTGQSSDGLEGFETALLEAMKWYDHGDRGALSELLDAAAHCDGETSELFGPWLGNAFIAHPRWILESVSLRPIAEQENLGEFAVSGDGGGLEPKKMKHIRKLLTQYSCLKEVRISTTAKLWLHVLDRFEADQADS